MHGPLWILVLNYNGLEDTRRCLRSLEPARADGAEVLVIDNASTEDPAPALSAEFPWCRFVQSGANRGYAGGNNVGIQVARQAGAGAVLILNNDTVAAPTLAREMIAAVEQHPDFGILGPVIYHLDRPDEVQTDGVRFNRPEAPGFFHRQEVPLTHTGRVAAVDIVNGCCLLITAAALDQLGGFDERFFLVHEESDLCLRAKRAGFRLGVLDRGLIWHQQSVTFRRSGGGAQRYFDARNLGLLLWKHPSEPGRRGFLGSIMHWLRYTYHRFCLEREAGNAPAADAVLAGLLDAFAGRFGPMTNCRRPLLPVLRHVFSAVHAARGGRVPEAVTS